MNDRCHVVFLDLPGRKTRVFAAFFIKLAYGKSPGSRINVYLTEYQCINELIKKLIFINISFFFSKIYFLLQELKKP